MRVAEAVGRGLAGLGVNTVFGEVGSGSTAPMVTPAAQSASTFAGLFVSSRTDRTPS